MKHSDIGIYGLGIMGQNLALNLTGKGFTVVVFNCTGDGEEAVTANFISSRCKERHIHRVTSPKDFVASIHRPRKVLLMVNAGEPVDAVIEQLQPYLEPGDIIIDGGNSHYRDSARRLAKLETRGLLFIGCGISGGSEGALHGPSLMPGGSLHGWCTYERCYRLSRQKPKMVKPAVTG